MACSLLIFSVLLISCFIEVKSNCENVVIITDFDPETCDRSKNLYYSQDIDGQCTPGCVKKLGLDERGCILGGDDCAPGLKCHDDDVKCVIDTDSEAKCYYQKATPSWTPSCLPDGTFAPKQCKGEAQNGRCYCFSKLGERIYGEEWSNKADNMTCACSRRRSDLERQGRTDVSLHCDTMGNYEPLQCDSESCWCADPQTGDVVAAVVPEEMMTVLPCYNKTLIGEQYLRQCESLLLAQNKIKSEFEIHGTKNILLPYVTCDFDGGYGRLKVEKGRVTCTWRDGKNIGSFATEQSQLKFTNCNCARDTKIYELVGKEMAKMCKGNGNYELLQHYENDKSFCIDNDGFITYGPTTETIDDCQKYLP